MSTANSDDNATPSCFSGILRRLLCSGSPTSSNHISPKQPNSSNSPRNHFQSKPQNAAHSVTTTTNPGVIARLMGLDALPVPEGINWTPKPRTTLESILRSKSVNSFDFVPQFDMKLAHHRRVRTSVSFREAPTFLSQEKHDLFVLCLEKLGKSEMGLVEEHKVEEEKNRGNRDKNNTSGCLKADDLHGNRRPKPRRETRKTTNSGGIEASNQEEKHIRTADSKMRRRKKESSSSSCKHGGVGGGGGRRRRRIQPVCALEDDSGSGSLLHLPNITDSNHHEMIATRPEDRRARISNSTRKPTSTKNSSTREYENVQERKSFKDDRPMRTKEETSTTTTTTPTCDVQELVEICKRLAEEGLKDSIWTANRFVNSFEHIEEICTLFEQQILDLMFDQLIDDLVEC